MILSKIYAGFGILGAIVLSFGVGMTIGYIQGKKATLETLKAERIITLEEMRAIDDKVFSADESALCNMLGGC